MFARVATILGDMDGADFLPNDLAECQRLLLAAFKQATELERRRLASEQRATELKRVLDETAVSYRALQQEHAATLEELAWYKRWAYGRRRERLQEDQGQGHLFDLDAGSPIPTDLPQPGDRQTKPSRCGPLSSTKKREIDWDKLPQIRHEHDLSRSGEDSVPAVADRWTVSARTSPGNWNCSRPSWKPTSTSGRNTPAAAARRASVRHRFRTRPIPGGIAGPGLIAEVIVSKFGDHLPLYRLEDILARSGVYIARSTLCDWVQVAAELFRPLYELQRQRVLQSTVMWTDDTPVTVLGGLEGSFQGRFLDLHRL